MGDDLIPNQGGTDYFDVPDERIEEERRQNGVLSASYPVLSDVAKWFDEQVENCDRISNIDLSAPQSAEVQIMAYQLLRSLLEQKAAEFSEFKDD